MDRARRAVYCRYNGRTLVGFKSWLELAEWMRAEVDRQGMDETEMYALCYGEELDSIEEGESAESYARRLVEKAIEKELL